MDKLEGTDLFNTEHEYYMGTHIDYITYIIDKALEENEIPNCTEAENNDLEVL